jgi:heme/copper-type cytochrome/quinol oxidase subunit 3
LVLQGTEWVKLVRYGLTSSSSLYGSLFYTLVGCHALHVLAALFALAWVLHAARSGRYGSDNLDALLGMRLYWVFVVAVWPLLYALVYLW